MNTSYEHGETGRSGSSDGTSGPLEDGQAAEAAGAVAPDVAGDSFVWVGPLSGDWGTASNWKDETAGADPAAAPPGVADTAAFDSPTTGTQTISGTGAAAALTLNGNNDVAGQITAGTLTAGILAASSSLTVSAGASLTAAAATLDQAVISIDGGSLAISGLLALAGSNPTGFDFVAMVAETHGAVIQAGSLSVAGVYLSVDATSSIEVGTAGGASQGELTVDPGADLLVAASDDPYGGELLDQGGIVDDGVITVAAEPPGAEIDLLPTGYAGPATATLSGVGSVVLQTGASAYLGDLAGTVSVQAGAGADVSIAGLAVGGPISLDGGDVLGIAGQTASYDEGAVTFTTAYNVQSAVKGFDASDAIIIDTAADGAVYSAATGMLTLSDEGSPIAALNLGSGYAGDTFVALPETTDPAFATHTAIVLAPGPAAPGPSGGTAQGDDFTWIGPAAGDWNTAANWRDDTAGATPAAVAPGAADSVTFGAQTALEVVGGVGDSASLAFDGRRQLVTGALTTGALSLGSGSLVTVDPAGGLSAATASFGSDVSLDVVGGRLSVAGAATFSSDIGDLSAAEGARVQLGSLSAAGDSFGVDATSSIEVGTAGAPALGALTVDPGAALSIDDLEAGAAATSLDSGSLIDNGTVTIQAGPGSEDLFLSLVGYPGSGPAPFGLTGTGVVALTAGSSIDASASAVEGSLTFQLANGADLALADVGAGVSITLAGSDTLSISSTLGMDATIQGYTIGDVLDFNTSFSQSLQVALLPSATGGTLELVDSSDDDAVVASVNLSGTLPRGVFTVAQGGLGLSISLANAPAPMTVENADGTSSTYSFGVSPTVFETILQHSGPDGTGAAVSEVVDDSDLTSLLYAYNPSAAIVQTAAEYSGTDPSDGAPSGSQISDVVNDADGTSLVYQYDPTAAVTLNVAVYGTTGSGGAPTGSPVSDVVDDADGTSLVYEYDPSSTVKLNVVTYAATGSDGAPAGSPISDILDEEDGSSVIYDYNPSSTITQAVSFYGATNSDGSPAGTLLLTVIDYTSGAYAGIGSSVTTGDGTIWYSGADGTGTQQPTPAPMIQSDAGPAMRFIAPQSSTAGASDAPAGRLPPVFATGVEASAELYALAAPGKTPSYVPASFDPTARPIAAAFFANDGEAALHPALSTLNI